MNSSQDWGTQDWGDVGLAQEVEISIDLGVVTAGVGGVGVGRVRLTGAVYPGRPDGPGSTFSYRLAGLETSLRVCSWSGMKVSSVADSCPITLSVRPGSWLVQFVHFSCLLGVFFLCGVRPLHVAMTGTDKSGFGFGLSCSSGRQHTRVSQVSFPKIDRKQPMPFPATKASE